MWANKGVVGVGVGESGVPRLAGDPLRWPASSSISSSHPALPAGRSSVGRHFVTRLKTSNSNKLN